MYASETDSTYAANTYTYRWGEVRDFYLKVNSGGRGLKPGSWGKQLGYSIANGGNSGWEGADAATARDWVQNGYLIPGHVQGSARGLTSDTLRPRWTWSDDPEGELDCDMYLMGETDCYRSRKKRPKRGGVKVEIGIGFHAKAKAPLMAAYGDFISRLLADISRQGFDMQVTVFSDSKGVHGAKKTRHRIIVSEFGRRTMMREWSALFSPIAHRHLIFATRAIPQQEGKELSAGPGGSRHGGFSLTYDRQKRTLRIDCHDSAETVDDFPGQDMIDSYRAALRSM